MTVFILSFDLGLRSRVHTTVPISISEPLRWQGRVEGLRAFSFRHGGLKLKNFLLQPGLYSIPGYTASKLTKQPPAWLKYEQALS